MAQTPSSEKGTEGERNDRQGCKTIRSALKRHLAERKAKVVRRTDNNARITEEPHTPSGGESKKGGRKDRQ